MKSMSTASVTCSNCGKQLELNTGYFKKYGEDPFCQDCLIHTECNSCGRGLRLEPSRYKELGGDPVICTDCEPSQTTSSSRSGVTFWSGLSSGEKILFLVVLIALLGRGSYIALTSMNGGATEGGGLLGLTLILYWISRRGR